MDVKAATDASEFSLNFVGGPIKFRGDEGVFFSKLFHIVDNDGDGFVGGLEGAAFIRRANLPNDANREVWRLASGGKSQDKLGKDSWFVAMKLVALIQSCGKCKLQLLYEASMPLPLPDFHLEGPPDNVLPSPPDGHDRHFKITVSSPTVVGTSYNRFTQYIVSTTTDSPLFPMASCQVRRRFSDFEWLHQRLTDRFRGTIIPPIPEKRWTGNMDATFVEERRQALEHFINEVCNHEKLSKTFEVQIMLTANNEGLVAGRELLAIQPAVAAYVPKASSVTGLWSSVRDSLFVSNVQQAVEIKTDEDYAKIGEQIDVYRKRIEDLVRCSDVVYTAQRAEGYELSRCGTYFSNLAVHERMDVATSQLMGSTGECFEALSLVYQDQLDAVLANYVSNIRYLAGKVGAVKTVLSNREHAIKEVHLASATMHRNKERFAAARASSGAAASAMIAEQKMVSAEDRMNTAKEQVDFIASSLKVETQRLYLGKAAELKQSLLALARTHIAYHAKARESWAGLLPDIGVSERDVAASIERTSRPVVFARPGAPRSTM
ncbi:hypothetical protein SPRG_19029 [Saprolegnia parasitica CBS 223.65]|uniref:PX domain-containing protein n=1 Tax=Saprolegnia parasitica (strain CBS 223.65) TaxID=695850 RepID=A0A067CUN5_SAPPC|nr:hypothetical protein SPRG_19029 [Saprolegnia parasitica CBS 223.65]KDO34183.1 hypothetical protein SPRG_19029 [Saprolegnia parasitica CBS 223.65]|eukprot:XP_012195228.1 hypothetical protein SPRG_19029 [Saprolegnia parasitica CBS 223.65]